MSPLAQQAWSRLSLSLSTAGLQALRRGLQADDPRLSQDPMTAYDAVSYCLWFGDGIESWDALRKAWAAHLRQADLGYESGDPPSWAWLAWHDMTPRPQMIAELLELVTVELERRQRRGPLSVSVC